MLTRNQTQLITVIIIISGACMAGLLPETKILPISATNRSNDTTDGDQRIVSLDKKPAFLAQADIKSTDQLNKQAIQELVAKVAKLEAIIFATNDNTTTENQTQYPYTDITTAEEHIFQQQQEAQRMVEQSKLNMQELLNRHSSQAIDLEWAPEKEDNMIAAFDSSQLQKVTKLSSIDCRSTMCTLEFSVPRPTDETPNSGGNVFNWVSANAGACAFIIESPKSGDNGSSQRVFLDDCTDTPS